MGTDSDSLPLFLFFILLQNYLYMVFNDFSLHPDHSGTTSVNLNIIIFSDLILTIHYKPVHSIYTVCDLSPSPKFRIILK